jgi:hypothetical protein
MKWFSHKHGIASKQHATKQGGFYEILTVQFTGRKKGIV